MTTSIPVAQLNGGNPDNILFNILQKFLSMQECVYRSVLFVTAAVCADAGFQFFLNCGSN